MRNILIFIACIIGGALILDFAIDNTSVQIHRTVHQGASHQSNIKPSPAHSLDILKEYPEAYRHIADEMKLANNMSPQERAAHGIEKYLKIVFQLPWDKPEADTIDLKFAKSKLDEEHKGLDDIKKRILEFLAGQNRSKNLKAPVICFVGPPGVGKTTLAESIAKATGRKFERVSLGGVSDEAAIRGFMRTYRGARPGKIIEAVRKMGTKKGLILLDEVDKMGKSSFNGDPAAALLEVLDPSQNTAFEDHYLEVPYDLSQIMFITTANSYEIPPALRDRMEIIELSSYTSEEKFDIAKTHLLPKQLKKSGMKQGEVVFKDAAIKTMIKDYTAESGVRNLTRVIQKLIQKIIVEIDSGRITKVTVDSAFVIKALGASKSYTYQPHKEHKVGLVYGLAYTSVGGVLLPVEAMALPGKGKIERTGNMGDVQLESIMAARTLAKSLMPKYGKKVEDMNKLDIHIHMPNAAVKKDGPSAGVTMTTAIISAVTGKKIRNDVCMTGEVTIYGDVMPIGGLKEKLLAAYNLGLKIAFIPFDNARDLEKIPEVVKLHMKIIPVKRIEEILEVALVD